MSIISEVERLETAKQNIKESIINKSVLVPDSASISEYSTYINQISTGAKLSINDLSYMFYKNSRVSELNKLLSSINEPTKTDYMFSEYTAEYDQDQIIDNIDFSNTLSMRSMYEKFSGIKNSETITSLDFTGIDTSSCTDMSYMFADADNLNLLTVPFDTSSVTTMERMFYSMRNLVSIDLTSFDTKSVTNMDFFLASSDKLTTCYNFSCENEPGLGSYVMGANVVTLTYKSGCGFGQYSNADRLTLNLANCSKLDYNTFANSIAPNTTGLTRIIDFNSGVFNRLTAEQKAILTDKNYTIQ